MLIVRPSYLSTIAAVSYFYSICSLSSHARHIDRIAQQVQIDDRQGCAEVEVCSPIATNQPENGRGEGTHKNSDFLWYRVRLR